MKICWCGCTKLDTFSPDYAKCPECGTLVSLHDISQPQASAAARDNPESLYGFSYWSDGMTKKSGFETLDEMLDERLVRRAAYWLRHILKYKLPPGTAHEIGGGLGELCYYLDLAGFDATEHELSRELCKWMEANLGVKYSVGEFSGAAPSDLIIANDLIEHIADINSFMQNITASLKDDGVLVIQTPCYDGVSSYDEMLQKNARFPLHMLPEQHVFLYSRKSLSSVFDQYGLNYVFEDAFFGNDYDQYVFASKRKLEKNSEKEISEALKPVHSGRALNALTNHAARQNAAEYKLNAEIVARDGEIRRLTNETEVQFGKITEANKELEDLGKEIAHRDKEIVYLGREIGYRNREIEYRDRETVFRDREIKLRDAGLEKFGVETERLEREIIRLEKEAEKRKSEAYRLTEGINRKNREIGQFKDIIKSRESEIARINGIINLKSDEAAKLNDDITELNTEIVSLKDKIKSDSMETVRLNAILEVHEIEEAKLGSEAAILEEKIKLLSGEKELKGRELERLKFRNKSADKETAKLKAELDARNKESEILSNKNKVQEKKIMEMNQDMALLRVDIASKHKTMQELSAKIEIFYSPALRELFTVYDETRRISLQYASIFRLADLESIDMSSKLSNEDLTGVIEIINKAGEIFKRLKCVEDIVKTLD